MPDPALVRWEAPETFDADSASEIRTSRLMTPYLALSMAVRNEERAFAFWSCLAALSDDAEIKKVAEAMAREELGHVSILRKERRRAYHREHDAARVDNQGEIAGSPGERRRATRVDARTLELLLVAQLADLERRRSGTSAARTRALRRDEGDVGGSGGLRRISRPSNRPTHKPSLKHLRTRI